MLSTLIFALERIRPLLELPTLIFADVRIKQEGGGGGGGGGGRGSRIWVLKW